MKPLATSLEPHDSKRGSVSWPEPLNVLVLLFDNVQSIDVTGPLDAYAAANRSGGAYRLRAASLDGRPVHTNVGLRLVPDVAVDEVDFPVHALIVPGRPDWREAVHDLPLLESVRYLAKRSRTVASVGSGAFPVAAAGLLDGRRAATHWSLAADFAARFPRVRVDPDAIFVRDGDVVTSAGATAGIDLALSLVECDLGADVARAAAKHLVVFMVRPGGQSQFSVRQTSRQPRYSLLRTVLDDVAVDPGGDHSVLAIANRAGVSPRHLSRLFRTQTGGTVAQYVERVRVEAAQSLLEAGDDALDAVARRSGFNSDETMRRAFRRRLGVSPGTYRAQFRATSPRVELHS